MQITFLLGRFALLVVCGSLMVLHEKYAKEPWRHIGLKVPHHGGGGGGGGPPPHMKFSRDAAIPRIPAPHLLKQGQLQLAGASFRDEWVEMSFCYLMDRFTAWVSD